MDPDGTHGQVTVLKIEPSTSKKIPENPFIVRATVESHLKAKIEGGLDSNDGQIHTLAVRSKDQVTKLKQLTQLLDGTPIVCAEHPTLNTVRCIIVCRQLVPMQSEKEIVNYLNAQNDHVRISEARRMTRTTGGKPEILATTVVTVEGTVRPGFLYVGYRRYQTRPYYPGPMMCYNCFRFGHTSKKCKTTTATCGHCSQQHQVIRGVQCTLPQHCSRCNLNDHSLGSRRCPAYIAENEIQKIKIDKGIPYPEARRLHLSHTGQSSFAGVAVASKDNEIAQLKDQVKKLAATVAAKDAEILHTKTQTQQTSTIPTRVQEELGLLRDVISQLKAEILLKDARLSALERASPANSEPNSNAEIIARLTALEASAAKKDQLIAKLEKDNQELRKKVKELSAKPVSPKPKHPKTTHPTVTKQTGSKDGQDREEPNTSNLQSRLELTRTHGTIEDLVNEIKLLKEQKEIQPGRKKQLSKAPSDNSGSKKPKGSQSPKNNGTVEDSETMSISDDDFNATDTQKDTSLDLFDMSSQSAIDEDKEEEFLP